MFTYLNENIQCDILYISFTTNMIKRLNTKESENEFREIIYQRVRCVVLIFRQTIINKQKKLQQLFQNTKVCCGDEFLKIKSMASFS